ncbi:MAG: homogentisate phytyltransferase [Candidatus Promineifilaceae bacterium]|nr:homogentisate phytyltransferase [Candidatus Promineifilaceae bacterium]
MAQSSVAARKVGALLAFSRPHTVVATALQVGGLFLLAGGADNWRPAVLLLGLGATVAANLYIVGLNQLADVEIDRINKPDLPLPAGTFTLSQGRAIVIVAGLIALTLAATQSIWLLVTVALSMLIGTAYSLPPFFLKGRALVAALSIALVRGIVANIGLFGHFHLMLQPRAGVPWALVGALAIFFFGFGLVIALYKDIPDLEGDQAFGVSTFTVRLGPRRVFRAGRWLLTAIYLLPLALAVARLPAVDGLVLLLTHLLALAWFWWSSQDVDPTQRTSVTSFYMTLWSLFYIEYLLLGLYEIAGVFLG